MMQGTFAKALRPKKMARKNVSYGGLMEAYVGIGIDSECTNCGGITPFSRSCCDKRPTSSKDGK